MLISTVVIIATISINQMSNWQYTQTMNLQSITGNTAIQLAKQEKVNALVAYKFLKSNESQFGNINVTIQFEDGTVTADFRQLLRCSQKDFYLEVNRKADNLYTIRLLEVVE